MKKNLKKFVIVFTLICSLIMICNQVFATDSLQNEDFCDDTSSASLTLVRNISAIITLVKLGLKVIAIILLFLGFFNYFKNRKNENNELRKKVRNKLMIFIIISIVLFCSAGILDIVTQFAAKPIIYIYPEKEQVVNVKLGKKENITCSYPKYEDGWEIIAKPNGDLVDCKTGRNLYALYWEGKENSKPNYKEGFIVKGEDTIKFLEEKLEILGLNERESEEFIVYWLPELEDNKYNYIRFQTMEEINENMPLEIEPKPDTIIRVMMEYKSVSIPFEVEEQKLETPERNGFTVVEWGGTRL